MPERADDSLRRSLSGTLLLLYGVGTILGAGIYALIGEVGAVAGTAAPSSFFLAGLLALLTGASFAELSARFPRSAGEAVYVTEGLRRPRLGMVVGLLVTVTGIVSAATVAVSIPGYLSHFVQASRPLVLTAVVVIFAALASWGILQSVVAASLITLVEAGGLLLVIVAAGDSLVDLPERAGDLMPAMDAAGLRGVFLGSFLAFFAFIGFEDMVNVAEEVKNPSVNLPRAIFGAIAISTLLYMAVSIVASLAMSPQELAASKAPLADVYARHTGRTPELISAISLVAVSNGALIQIIMGSRVLYGLAQEERIPSWFGVLHHKTQTPIRATLLISAIVLILALSFPLATLAQITSFVILIVFALVNLSLWRIKRRGEATPGVIRLPAVLPLLGFLASSSFLVLRTLEVLGLF
jgi:amino acid transporter